MAKPKKKKNVKNKYANLSALAYATSTANKEKYLQKMDKADRWALDRELSNRDVSVLKNKHTGEIVVSVRGTDLDSKDTRGRDLRSDIGIAFGVSHLGKRNKEVKKIVEKTIKKYGKKPTICGHSLGGKVASNIGKSMKLKTYTFNQGSSPTDIVSATKRFIKCKLKPI